MEMKSKLSDCMDQLQKLVIKLNPISSDKSESTLAYNQVAKRYTMNLERGVHNKITGGLVDFTKVRRKEPESRRSKCELPGQVNSENPDLTTAEDKTDDNLGDNVELF